MGKPLASSKEIVKQEQPSLPVLKPEQEAKAELIFGYLQKYALIETRVLTPELIAVYCEALDDFDLRRIRKGLKKYLEQGTRWPWPGTLAEWIEEEI